MYFLYFYLGYFYVLISLSLIYGLLTVRRHSPVQYRVMLWWLAATLPTEVTAFLVGHFYHRNHWVYNIWVPIECCFILLMFYKGAVQGRTRGMCRWLLILLPVGVFVSYLPHFVWVTLNIHEMLFCLFCELLGACIYLIDNLLGGEDLSIFRQPLSWMAFGTILYACVFILTHGLWEFILVWPRWRYGMLVVVANTFQYGGVLLTLLALRKSNRQAEQGIMA